MGGHSVAAIDLGASSGRVVLLELKDEALSLREVNRFPHGPELNGQTLCWDLPYLWNGVEEGLAKAFELNPNIEAIGVDGWGVDFVFVDENDQAKLPAISYRDARTKGIMPEFASETGLDLETLFRRTGIQPMELNSLFQLYALKREREAKGELDEHPGRLMLLPDWFHFQLTGRWACEYTNATTSQMLSPHDGDWDPGLIELLGLPRSAMPTIKPAGTVLGHVKESFLKTWGVSHPVPVVLPGTHDTASAVASLPASAPGPSFISLGTWALVGREAPVPDLSHRAYLNGLSNEGGVFETYRQLRNVSGLWLIQNVRNEIDPTSDFADWAAEAEAVEGGRSLIEPMDPRFFRTPSMVKEIQAQCRETGQPIPESRGELARTIYESLALSFADVLSDFNNGEQLPELHLVGGGARNALLCQMICDVINAPVIAGPFEASAIGNGVVQMIGLGVISDIAEARRLVRQSCELIHYEPRAGEDWSRLRSRFHSLYSAAQKKAG